MPCEENTMSMRGTIFSLFWLEPKELLKFQLQGGWGLFLIKILAIFKVFWQLFQTVWAFFLEHKRSASIQYQLQKYLSTNKARSFDKILATVIRLFWHFYNLQDRKNRYLEFFRVPLELFEKAFIVVFELNNSPFDFIFSLKLR